jgi:hypothetical protein
VTNTYVKQENAWRLEPFFGTYNHKIILDTYKGKWNEQGVLGKTQRATSPIYIREYSALQGGKKSQLPSTASLLESNNVNVDITSAVVADGALKLRLNERTGKSQKVKISTPKGVAECEVKPFAIVEQALK